jgi:hypothetical protein
MASRKEQKEQARERRLAEEQVLTERAQRERRLRMLGGVVVLAVTLAAVAIAISSGSSPSRGLSSPTTPVATNVKLPSWRIKDLTAAEAAAGCVQINTPDSVARTDQNRTHVDPGTKVNYRTNPPSYGPHYPVPASDGEYAPGHTPAVGYVVHAMEHGRVEYQYSPALAAGNLNDLDALFNERDGEWAPGQLLLLFQNATGMPYTVAATAWGHVLGCKTFTSRVFDALRDFRLTYTNHGPEQLGTGPE